MHRRKFLANLLWSTGVVLSGSKCQRVIENDNKSSDDKEKAAFSNTGTIIVPEQEIPVIAETDVLVIGGGPAGVAAALSASRANASTILVERYNHLGGLWTGGLV
ncbi:FAD-dependent oxidoreductase, partial [bacterium]|nr:FAD-dependent oxidoreductase [bacterium]